jgi:AraC-like DNA-binding protein
VDRSLLQMLTSLFEALPNVMFCVKDLDHQYLIVNQAFADRVARRSPAAVVGLRALDLFPAVLAASYEAQDDRVATSGRPLLGQLELVLRPDGQPGWYLTNKVLLGQPGSQQARIVALSVDLEAATPGGTIAESLKHVVDHIRIHFAQPLQVRHLAEIAELSVIQLERRFHRVFGVSAKQYALRVRLEEAVSLLLRTELPLGEVATRSGYYDQSAFTRHVKRAMGVTPRQLRAGYG